ncbi:U-box domain-containing protein 45-like [Nicotiana tabacum]|uniref:U-box domain-containing protein 12-like n=1 Tax=Nicotiana tabacum TaxID=4097 RepID=A0A1S4DCC4_TOBAC|nr:U-box domain-containing protein 12 [Nicotiana tomentosiformis]XP_016511090.1 PREDICTED: U-box domain-containing protein 12-like [Nicotiana tabacum]
MGKCHRGNDVASVVLDRPSSTPPGPDHFKLWSSFSRASFRRMILDAFRCGGGGRHKRASKSPSDQPPPGPGPVDPVNLRSECERNVKQKKPAGSDRLSELLRLSESSENEEDVRRKEQMLEELKGVVKRLQSSHVDAVLEGAKEVRRFTKEDSDARTTLALLGAIPPLIALLDSEDSVSQIAALYALLNLGIGNDANKAAIVKAGAVHKMLKLVVIEFPNPEVAEAVVANFLGLSALDSNKPIIGSSGAIAFLVKTLKNVENTNSCQARQDSLRALYNLSISPLNVFPILESDLISYLMNKLGDMDVTERILSILCNVVSVAEARKAISSVRDVFSMLIDILSWTDAPGCQEKASYILMVMAHKSYGDRQTMIEAGVASALLELTLLGSTLAQKRASRILESLRVDKGKQVSENYGGGGVGATISAPQASTAYSSSVQLKDRMDDDMMSEEKKAVKQLVQQSLQSNMKRIVKRANLPHEFVPSDHLKSLTSSSTSKSLPF